MAIDKPFIIKAMEGYGRNFGRGIDQIQESYGNWKDTVERRQRLRKSGIDVTAPAIAKSDDMYGPVNVSTLPRKANSIADMSLTPRTGSTSIAGNAYGVPIGGISDIRTVAKQVAAPVSSPNAMDTAMQIQGEVERSNADLAAAKQMRIDNDAARDQQVQDIAMRRIDADAAQASLDSRPRYDDYSGGRIAEYNRAMENFQTKVRPEIMKTAGIAGDAILARAKAPMDIANIQAQIDATNRKGIADPLEMEKMRAQIANENAQAGLYNAQAAKAARPDVYATADDAALKAAQAAYQEGLKSGDVDFANQAAEAAYRLSPSLQAGGEYVAGTPGKEAGWFSSGSIATPGRFRQKSISPEERAARISSMTPEDWEATAKAGNMTVEKAKAMFGA